MTKLHLIGGEKGGVGKSFTARLLAQYHIDTQKSFLGFDSDRSHTTFSRFYGEFTNPIDVENYSSLDQLVEAAEEQPDMDLIVDLAAQTAHKLNTWIDETDVFGIMDELNVPVYYWHVMDDGADSMHLLKRLLERLQDKNVQIVVVQNYGRGKSFQEFEHSPTRELAAREKAKFILLPNLEEQLARKIDFNDLSFWAAANNRHQMSTVQIHRMKVWLNFSYRQLTKAIG